MKFAETLIITYFPTKLGGHKETKLLKDIKGFYERETYKSAIASIEKILKLKNIELADGEVLALKGLILSRMGQHSEAYASALSGTEKKGNSIFCWVVLTFVLESNFDYEKAIESFEKAVEDEKFTMNIELFRYLSVLQAQMRNFPAFVKYKCKILEQEPVDRFHHLGAAVSYHLNNNHVEAIKVLKTYEDSVPDGDSSEWILYKIFLLEESGQPNKALEELTNNESIIVDTVAYKEQEASLLVKLNFRDEAKKIYMELLSLNPDNYSYFAGLRECLVSSDNASSEIQELQGSYTGDQHSLILRRMALNFLQGEEFKKVLDTYIRTLHERDPSFFLDLCPLYKEHPDKADLLDQVILELESSIRKKEGNEPVPLHLWTLLAQLHSRRGQYETALDKVNQAIQQNPAVAQLYLVKARLTKHAGDVEAAASIAKTAWEMDRSNSFAKKKYVKLMLQADKDEIFEKDVGDQHDSLQAMWYDIASGDRYFRQGDLGRSLKYYLAVVKSYIEMIEEHFDFHSARLRNMSLRAYFETLKYNKRLDPGSYFHKATVGIIRCYVELYDSSTKSNNELSKLFSVLISERSGANNTRKQQGKARTKELDNRNKEETTATRLPNFEKSRRKKSSNKHEKDCKKELCSKNEEETSASRAFKSGERRLSKPVGNDLVAANLLQVELPLFEATKYLTLLLKSSPDSFEACLLWFEITMRNQDFVQAYEALVQLDRLEKDNPDTLRCLVWLYCQLDGMDLDQSVQTALASPLSILHGQSILHKQSLIKLVENFLQQQTDSVIHTVAAAEMLCFLQPYKKSAIIEGIHESMEFSQDEKKKLWKHKDCIAVYRLLSVLGDAKIASRWEKECSELFPTSRYFSATNSTDSTSVETKEPEVWKFDSGATCHVITDANLLSAKTQKSGTIIVSSGNNLTFKTVGSISIESGGARSFLLRDVRHVSGGQNLVSISTFTQDSWFTDDTPYSFQFFYDGFLIRDTTYIELVSSKKECIQARGSVSDKHYILSHWELDSGATEHSTSDESLLFDVGPCDERIAVSLDGSVERSTRKGSGEIRFTSENGTTHKFVLKDVYVFPKGKFQTLLSVSVFARENKCSFLFTHDGYYILDAKDDMFLKPELNRGYGMMRKGLYYSR